MREEIINILNGNKEDAINILCYKYEFMQFQAEMIYALYDKLNNDIEENKNNQRSIKQLNDLINDITNEKLLSEESIKNMAREYCRSHLKRYDKAEFFLKDIGMESENIDTFLSHYYDSLRYEDQMLSEELDVHALNVQINQLLDDAGTLLAQSQSKKMSL